MPIHPTCGLFVVSIDCAPPTTATRVDVQTPVRRVASEVRQLLDAYRVPATWSVSDPSGCWLRDELAAVEGHELAIFVGSSAGGRREFARRLRTCCHRAAAGGLSPSTLVTPDPTLRNHLDLLVKHGITAVRWDIERSSGKVLQPSQLRYGVTNLPASIVVPGPPSWLRDRTIGRAGRAVRNAAKRRQVCHVAINCLRLAASTHGMRSLRRLIQQAARSRDNNRLMIATMRQATTLLTRSQQATPARSILRAA